MSDERPYDALLVRGEERKRIILDVAQRLLTRNGWRTTTLAQIAAEAGVSPAGLLHHFESKAQLLHEVLEMRDADDDAHADRSADILGELEKVADRFERSPHLIGVHVVLQAESLQPDAPLHHRFLHRHQVAVETVADGIRRGQVEGRFRADLDAADKAVQVIAMLNGMETSWLLDPSTPVARIFREYVNSLRCELSHADVPCETV